MWSFHHSESVLRTDTCDCSIFLCYHYLGNYFYESLFPGASGPSGPCTLLTLCCCHGFLVSSSYVFCPGVSFELVYPYHLHFGSLGSNLLQAGKPHRQTSRNCWLMEFFRPQMREPRIFATAVKCSGVLGHEHFELGLSWGHFHLLPGWSILEIWIQSLTSTWDIIVLVCARQHGF